MADTPQEKRSEQLLDQYTTYVAMADSNSERRLSANRLYVSVLSLLLISIPFVGETAVPGLPSTSAGLTLVSAFSIVLSLGWFFNIWSYRELSRRKFAVITEMERDLPFACYTEEEERWPEDASYHWLFYRQSLLEQFIPLSLVLLHGGLLYLYAT